MSSISNKVVISFKLFFFEFTISNKTFVVKEKQRLADKFPMCNVLVTLVFKKRKIL